MQLLPTAKPKGVVCFFHGVKQHARSVEVLALAQHMVNTIEIAWCGLDLQGHGTSGQLGDRNHPLPPACILTLKSQVA